MNPLNHIGLVNQCYFNEVTKNWSASLPTEESVWEGYNFLVLAYKLHYIWFPEKESLLTFLYLEKRILWNLLPIFCLDSCLLLSPPPFLLSLGTGTVEWLDSFLLFFTTILCKPETLHKKKKNKTNVCKMHICLWRFKINFVRKNKMGRVEEKEENHKLKIEAKGTQMMWILPLKRNNHGIQMKKQCRRREFCITSNIIQCLQQVCMNYLKWKIGGTF